MVQIEPVRRRISMRHGVVVPCEAVAELAFRPVGRRLHDLSAEGTLLETDCEVTLGEEVFLSFRVPRTRYWVDAVARVVRVIDGRRTSDRVRGVGLRFLSMDPADRSVLEAAIRRIPPPIPARSRRMDYASFVAQVG